MEIILPYFEGFTPTQLGQFAALEELYRQWNARINLISRKDLDNLFEKHVLHSLSIAAMAGFSPGNTVLDLGTGGGFPGIPLAIFFPEVQFCLVDSMAKKIRAVSEIIRALYLDNAIALHDRVEQIRGRQFDFTVSRATAPLKELWAWSRPLLKKGNSAALSNGLICLKGGDLDLEISRSGCRPHIYEIFSIFPREYFREKYLLHVPL